MENSNSQKVQEVLDKLDKKMDKKRFRELSRKYARETSVMSMTVVNHPAFQELIAADDSIVPWMLEDLASYNSTTITDFDPWAHFSILHHHTGVWPADKKYAGKLKPIQHAWVKWGQDNGYLPQTQEEPEHLFGNHLREAYKVIREIFKK